MKIDPKKLKFIKDIMKTEVYYLNENDSLATMRNLLLSKKISHVIVLNDKEKIVGIATKRDLIDFICNHLGEEDLTQVPISKIMKKNVITINGNDPVEFAIKKMIENKISALPVVNNKGKIIGIISKKDILKYLNTLNLDYPIEKYVTKEVITIKPENTILQAAKKMSKYNVKKLVVVAGKEPIGIITENDIVFFNYGSKKKFEVTERKVRFVPGLVMDVMKTNLITCNKNEKMKDVIKKMVENNIDTCIVVDNDKHLYGIITITDVLKSYLDQIQEKE